MNKPLDQNQLIIGLGSRARIGKDFAAAELRKHYGEENVLRIAFADALKGDVQPLLMRAVGINPHTAAGPDKELIRPILVAYGEMMRKVNHNYWVARAIDLVEKTEQANHPWPIVVYTDCRYPNEVDSIKKMGGIYIEIDAPAIPPANESEAKNSPLCRAMADYVVLNDIQHKNGKFVPDKKFIPRLVRIIDSLGESVDYGLFRFKA